MEFFTGNKREITELSTKVGTLIQENEVLRSIVVRQESQFVTFHDDLSEMRRELFEATSILKSMQDGATSFKFTATGESGIKGYKVEPHYGAPDNVDDLSPEDQVREKSRCKVARLLYKYADVRNLSTDDKSFGVVYKIMFDKLEAATGYRPREKTVFKYLHPEGRKVYTLIEDGYTEAFVEVIQREIDKAASMGTAIRKSKRSRKRSKSA
ncbi:hypothetical protein ABH892_004427 [Paenibacillus sp. RC254]|uniref:hypothetical protein n=1 Tax=unclassified Paenibacillus TaxID=185978 RepID=UPI0024BB8D91|nr:MULTISPECIES: hypothetical protein [unclassified Paenibacillus]